MMKVISLVISATLASAAPRLLQEGPVTPNTVCKQSAGKASRRRGGAVLFNT